VSNLNQKRKRVFVAILAAVCGSGVVIADPTPSIEIPKQIFMTVADVAMCAVIWDIYFDEELSQKDIKSILVELGLITLISVGTAYVTAKAITGLISQLIDGLGSIGWGVAGLIAGLATALLGLAWAFYCDDLYRHPSR
jgi:hypothetical protein